MGYKMAKILILSHYPNLLQGLINLCKPYVTIGKTYPLQHFLQ